MATSGPGAHLPSQRDSGCDIGLWTWVRCSARLGPVLDCHSELALRTGIAQPTIARIEAGHVDPRVTTLERLLSVCGVDLAAVDQPGTGVDRTQIRELLRLGPIERLELLFWTIWSFRWQASTTSSE